MGKNKKRGGKRVKDGGQPGAKESKESSVNAGPVQVISKRSVNVLLIGHTGAGKSKALQKILKLGGKRESTVQKLKAIEDRSRESRFLPDARSMADTMAIHDNVMGTAAEFGEAHFETETTRYHILEAPSHYHYVYRMTSRALQADIAVLWVSGSKDDLPPNEKIQQTWNCIEVITTLDIPKILLVVNKMDDPSWTRKSFEEIVTKTSQRMPKPEKVVRSLPLSCETDSGIQNLFDSLDTIEVPPQIPERQLFRSGEDNISSIEYLVTIDNYLDDIANLFTGQWWYFRATALYGLGNFNEAFEAVDKAREFGFRNDKRYKKQTGPLKNILEGGYFRAIREFRLALEYFKYASGLLRGQKYEKAFRIVEDIIKEMNREKICVRALTKLEKNLDKSPNDPASWYKKAKYLADLKLFKEAFNAAEKALQYNYFGNQSHKKDDHPLYHKMEGDHCCARKNFGGAVEKYISACNGFLNKRCEKAVEMVQEIINECLDQDEKVKQQMNELKKTREEDLAKIDQLLLEDPKNAASWYNKGKILADLQKFVEAFEAAQKASDYNYRSHPLFKEENHPLFFKLEGDNYYAMQKFDDAHKHYIKARDVFESEFCEEAVKLSQVLVQKACIAWFNSGNEKMKKGVEKKKSSVISDASENKEVEEEVEEEVEMRQSVEVDPCLSSSNSMKKIKIFMSSEYLIDEKHLDYVYSGFKLGVGGNLPISLVDCTGFHKKNWEKLVSFGLNSTKIISVVDMVNLTVGAVSSTFLVVESVQTVEAYFTLLRDKWSKDKDSSLGDEERKKVIGDWWNWIKSDFKKIFRDILDGIVFLYTRDVTCGNLLNGAFVNAEGYGRLLPSMDFDGTHDDIKDVVTLIKRVLFSPLFGQKGEVSWLPDDVNSLMDFLLPSRKNLKFCLVPLWIDHPLVWSSEERAEFIIKLRRVLRRGLFPGLCQCMDEKMEGTQYDKWAELIPNGIIKEIWRKGDPELVDSSTNDLEIRSRGWFKIKPYVTRSDVIRFMNAVYTHYNDTEYKKFGTQELNISRIEKKLTKIFPHILDMVLSALYECVIDDHSALNLEALKEISRHSNMF